MILFSWIFTLSGFPISAKAQMCSGSILKMERPQEWRSLQISSAQPAWAKWMGSLICHSKQNKRIWYKAMHSGSALRKGACSWGFAAEQWRQAFSHFCAERLQVKQIPCIPYYWTGNTFCISRKGGIMWHTEKWRFAASTQQSWKRCGKVKKSSS